MKQAVCLLGAVLLLAATARAIPPEVTEAMPEAAEAYFSGKETFGPEDFPGGVGRILQGVREQVAELFRQQAKGAASILLSVLLCGAAGSICQEEEGTRFMLTMAGALAVTALSAGSLDQLIGLGWETIGELDTFSKELLPTLAAATAACGAVTTATFQQVTAVFLAGALLGLMNGLLMPLVYLYIGVLTASCTLPGNRLDVLADGLRRLITFLLTTSVLLFTVYLSVSRVIAGTADGMAVRAIRTALTNTVPVVGGILAQVSESVLVGAWTLKNSIGLFGMLAILAACVRPFLRLSIQYLLYKAVAVLASVAGTPELCRLIDGLGGAFGLVLGMTGSCALLLFVSVLSFVMAVAA